MPTMQGFRVHAHPGGRLLSARGTVEERRVEVAVSLRVAGGAPRRPAASTTWTGWGRRDRNASTRPTGHGATAAVRRLTDHRGKVSPLRLIPRPDRRSRSGPGFPAGDSVAGDLGAERIEPVAIRGAVDLEHRVSVLAWPDAGHGLWLLRHLKITAQARGEELDEGGGAGWTDKGLLTARSAHAGEHARHPTSRRRFARLRPARDTARPASRGRRTAGLPSLLLSSSQGGRMPHAQRRSATPAGLASALRVAASRLSAAHTGGRPQRR
jgi:hypothetical protein